MRSDASIDLSDIELAARVAQRSDVALGELFHRYSGQMLGLARRVLRDPAIAEEVVQDVFLKFWNDPAKFDAERGSLRSFLLALCTIGVLISSAQSPRAVYEKNATLALMW